MKTVKSKKSAPAEAVVAEFFHPPVLTNSWVARHGLSSAEYQTEFNNWTAKGYRPTQVSGYNDHFAVIFEKQANPPAFVARHGLTSTQYQAEFDNWTKQGFRLVNVSGYASGNQALYAALFEKRPNPPAWVAFHGMTSDGYQTQFNKWTALSYRVTDLSSYTVNGQDFYAAIFDKVDNGSTWVARHGMTSAEYQSEFNKYTGQGLTLTGVTANGSGKYAAIWEKVAAPAWQARHGMTSQQYQQTFDDLVGKQGYRLTWVNGTTINGVDTYAAIWGQLPTTTTATKLIKIVVNPQNGGVGFLGSDKKLYGTDMTLATLRKYDAGFAPDLSNVSTVQGTSLGVRSSDNALLNLWQDDTHNQLSTFSHDEVHLFKGKQVVGDWIKLRKNELPVVWAIGMDDRIYRWNALANADSTFIPLPNSRCAKDLAVCNGVVYIIDRDDNKIYQYITEWNEAFKGKVPSGVWQDRGVMAKQLTIDEGTGILWYIDLKGQVFAVNDYVNIALGSTAYIAPTVARSLAVFGRCPYIINDNDGFMYLGINNTWVKGLLSLA
jgi:Bacterial tandem repeat domain 1